MDARTDPVDQGPAADSVLSADPQTDALLNFIVRRGGHSSGVEFLTGLIRFIGDQLGVSTVLCGRYIKEPVETIETIAFCRNGDIAPNISYPLAGTPCENVINRALCVYPRNIQTLFP